MLIISRVQQHFIVLPVILQTERAVLGTLKLL